MSAHIPDHRRAIHGRTWDREWTPEAVEHHRASRLVRFARQTVAAAAIVAFAVLVGYALAEHFTGSDAPAYVDLGSLT